jgi:hypothetical protein
MYVCQTEFDFMPVWAALRILRISLFAQLSVASMALVAFQRYSTGGATVARRRQARR